MAGSRDISQLETGTLFIEDIKLCFLFSCRSREAIPSKPSFLRKWVLMWPKNERFEIS